MVEFSPIWRSYIKKTARSIIEQEGFSINKYWAEGGLSGIGEKVIVLISPPLYFREW